MIKISEETHRDLYYMPIGKCLDFCKQIEPVKLKDKTKFHAYWFIGSEFGRKQTMVIKSFLKTQNLETSEFVLWSNQDITNNEYLKPLLPFITFKIYDPVVESAGTIIEGRMDILKPNDDRNWAGGDLFRILALHKYGGVYTDMDIVYLRDFSPLLSQEFMYKWGVEDGMINGAVMHMNNHGKLSNDLLNVISTTTAVPNTTQWSTDLYQTVRKHNKDWTIFPSAFFNSEWQDDPDRNWGSNERNAFNVFNWNVYDGAFTWHWHNRWDNEILEGSKFKYYEDKFSL